MLQRPHPHLNQDLADGDAGAARAHGVEEGVARAHDGHRAGVGRVYLLAAERRPRSHADHVLGRRGQRREALLREKPHDARGVKGEVGARRVRVADLREQVLQRTGLYDGDRCHGEVDVCLGCGERCSVQQALQKDTFLIDTDTERTDRYSIIWYDLYTYESYDCNSSMRPGGTVCLFPLI